MGCHLWGRTESDTEILVAVSQKTLTGSYSTQIFKCTRYDSLSEVQMKLQWPLATPGENVDKMY